MIVGLVRVCELLLCAAALFAVTLALPGEVAVGVVGELEADEVGPDVEDADVVLDEVSELDVGSLTILNWGLWLPESPITVTYAQTTRRNDATGYSQTIM